MGQGIMASKKPKLVILVHYWTANCRFGAR